MMGEFTETQVSTADLPFSKDLRCRKLVRRSHFLQIIAAWVITVPAAAALSGFLFVVLRAVLV